MLLACLLFTAASPSFHCASSDDCSLLGVCTAGACVCNAGWTGASCATMDLLALDTTHGYVNPSAASWGGRPIKVGVGAAARWHMAVTEIKNKCPLILFQYNSQVVRAVSASANVASSYTRVSDAEGGTILPPFHHNPTLIGPTPDGVYLIFFIGAANSSNEIDCRAGLPDVPTHPSPAIQSNGYITMAWTKDPSLKGPWSTRVVLRDNGPGENQTSWHCIENNPSVFVLANGTVVMTYRANGCDKQNKATSGEHLGIAVSPHWSGEFVRDPHYFVGPDTAGGANNEDPFLWYQIDPKTSQESWHIVNHQQSSNNVCGVSKMWDNRTKKWDTGHTCGAHWYAHSMHGPWKQSTEPAYTENVTFVNGSTGRYLTRQRPQLVFAEDGVTPLALFNGASFEGNNPDLAILTHTYVQQFNHNYE